MLKIFAALSIGSLHSLYILYEYIIVVDKSNKHCFGNKLKKNDFLKIKIIY